MKRTRNKKRGGRCCKYESPDYDDRTCLGSTAHVDAKNAKQGSITIPFREFNGFTTLKFKVRNHALKHADQYRGHEGICFDTIFEEKTFRDLLSNVVKDYLLVPDGGSLNDIGEQKIIEQQDAATSLHFHVPYDGGNLLCRSYLEHTRPEILFIEIYGIQPNGPYNNVDIYPAPLPAAPLPAAPLPAAAAADEDDHEDAAGHEKMVDDLTAEPVTLEEYFKYVGVHVDPSTIKRLKEEEYDVSTIKLVRKADDLPNDILQVDIDNILNMNGIEIGGSRKRKRKRRRTLKKRVK